MKGRRLVSILMLLGLVLAGPAAIADVADLGRQAAPLLPAGTAGNSAVERAGVFQSFLTKNAGIGNLVYSSVGYVPAYFTLGLKNTTLPEQLGSRYALAASLATSDPGGRTLADGSLVRQGYPNGCAGISIDVEVPIAFHPDQIGITNTPWRLGRAISSRGNYFDPTDPDGEGPMTGLLAFDDTNANVIERGTCNATRNPSCDAHVTFLTPVFTKADHAEPGLPGIMGRSWFVITGTPQFGPPYGSFPDPNPSNIESSIEDDLNDHVTLEFMDVDADGDGKADELWLRQDERLWAGAWISDNRVSKPFAEGALQNLIHDASTQKSGSIYVFGNRQRIYGGTGLFTAATGEVITNGTFRIGRADFSKEVAKFNYLDSYVYVRIPCANSGVVPTNCIGLPKDGAGDYSTPKASDQVACNDGVDNDGDGACDWNGCGSMPSDRECKTPWSAYEAR